MRLTVPSLAITAAFAFVSLAASTSSAREIDLQCFTDEDGSTTNMAMAKLDEVGEYSAPTGGAALDARVFEFKSSGDTEMICTTILPSDYDQDSTTNPAVTFYGWLTQCIECLSSCGNFNCSSTTQDVEFEVSARRYADGSLVGGSWGAVDSDTGSQSCTASVCSGDGFAEGIVRKFEADATDDASNWAAGDLVFIRLQRDTSITDNLPAAYAITAVQLDFPTN